ncbi:GTP-binding protein [Streptomyces dangxiongensis]|uniref:GTP-binding protein n=1 Tax=Streptomyces dangxiongensis TaxID=1442032 RepID=A0A3G2JIX0_9ACTN|nr:caspase family protein [Streptomyces dangxiongensis]AYN40342.1 GTP-binding protein [Streptomyces dangxiongensis]
MSAGRRRALLIAVPAYPQLEQVPELKDDFPALPFTARDAATLRNTLLRSNFPPEHVTVLDDEDTTDGGTVRDELGRFLNSCEDGDVGLVYFAGHGVRFGETDYLLPSDTRARWGPDGQRTLGPQGLIEVVPDELLAPLTSSATVMLVFDACRSGGGTPAATFEGVRVSRDRDNVVMLSACSPGEEALGHPDSGSVLARALSESLAPESSASTFGEVIRRVQRRAPQIAANYTSRRPPGIATRWLSFDGKAGSHADVPLCEAMTSSGPWMDAVVQSDLWERTGGTDAQQARAKGHLAEVVTKVGEIRGAKQAESDPWDDPLVQERLIKRLGHLLEAADARLSLIETVVLLGAPFLREAALACGLQALRNLRGDGPDDTATAAATVRPLPEGTFAWHLDRDMGDVRRAHRQIEATRRTLLRRGRKDDARGAEYWLRHRFLADWDLLWEERGDTELESLRRAVDLLVRAAESAADLTLGAEGRDKLRHAVIQVVSQLGTGTPADTVAPDGTDWETDLCTYLCGEERWSWRPRDLAALLHLAGLLAIDPRMLDGVLIDHLGPREPTQVRPESIIGEITTNDGFRPSTGGRSGDLAAPGQGPSTRWLLVFKCGNAALYTALERLTTRIITVSEATRRNQGAVRTGDLLSGLPKVIKTDGLMPRNNGFDRPPPRFRLAEDEVKPLIMGTQLYGDRMLAVRELYQNALDACRVRQARRRYWDHARQTGDETEQEQLAGCRIVFTQDVDPATGRTYIECEDNGVGMTAEELRDLFAQAGRRSEQSSSRMREMRRWRRRGITTELNSRFGIGVFSYFMLAEEVEVVTRPVTLSGSVPLEDGHRASVTAGSGLMHLSREQTGLENGGTRVRLYLHDEPDATEDQRPSLVQALREFLISTPLEVTAREHGRDPVTWRPGELYGDSSLPGTRIKATEGVWWVQGTGMLLADGLLVSEDDAPDGYVVNLRARHRLELSVDRNRFLGYDEHRVEEDLEAAVPALVRKAWRPFPLEWLWNLAEARPRIAEQVIGRLMEADVRVSVPAQPLRDHWILDHRDLTLADVGCLPVDEAILRASIGEADLGVRFFAAWRAGVLGVQQEPEPVTTPAGFPRPEPLDAMLFRSAPDRSWREPLRAAMDTGRSLREVTRRLRRYALTGAFVPEVADIRVLDDIVPNRLAATLYEEFRDARGSSARGDDESRGHALRQAMVRVSAAEKVSLGSLAQLLAQLSAVDPSIPDPPDLGPLETHRVDARERRVLLNDRATSSLVIALAFSGPVRPVDVAYRAHQTGIPPAEIEAVVRRFEPLGYRLTGPDLPCLLDEEQLDALSRDLDAEPPFLTPGPIGLRHLVRLAAKREETVGATAAWLAGWATPLGVEVAEPGPLASLVPPGWCRQLPAERAATRGHGDAPGASPITTWQLLGRIADVDDPASRAQHIAAVEALAEAGLAERGAVEAARTWLSRSRSARPRSLWGRSSLSLRQRSSGRPLGSRRFGRRDARIGLSSLMALAADSEDDLGTIEKRVRDQLAPYGFDVPEIPREAVGLRPDDDVVTALSSRDGRWREGIWLHDLVRFAYNFGIDLVTAAAVLNEYRSLGAPTVPVPPGSVPPSERVERDEAAEIALLQAALERSWTLTPLALVVAAGRLGSGLRETYRRLRPFVAIGLDIPFPEPGCTRVPDWRDVVLLTARFTGREPVLSGDVPEDHIRLAAEETDLTADDVRARLRDYAPLFGLRLPPYERS